MTIDRRDQALLVELAVALAILCCVMLIVSGLVAGGAVYALKKARVDPLEDRIDDIEEFIGLQFPQPDSGARKGRLTD